MVWCRPAILKYNGLAYCKCRRSKGLTACLKNSSYTTWQLIPHAHAAANFHITFEISASFLPLVVYKKQRSKL